LDGLPATLYIVITWNLVCQEGNNTSKIQLSHLKWTVFDALQVNFKHTKVDQQGDTKCKKCHLFLNVFEYYINLPFLLGLYFACCFTFGQARGQQLFPGGSKSQAKRISAILPKIVESAQTQSANSGIRFNQQHWRSLHPEGDGIVSGILVWWSAPCGNMSLRRLDHGPVKRYLLSPDAGRGQIYRMVHFYEKSDEL
jgi:hypothetical protein